VLILASASDLLQLITSAAGSINVHASYLDNVAGTVAPGRANTNITTAATTTIVPAPAAGTFRNLKTLHVYNAGPSSNTVTIQHTDGTIVAQIHQTALQPGQDLQYRDEAGFAFLFGNTMWTTGDAKLTLKTVADPTWLMMNDGTIGSAASGSGFADPSSQPLFALLFGNVSDAAAPIQTSTGAATTRAAQVSAGAAWTANCRMSLTKQLGRALCIGGTGAGLTARALGSNIGLEMQSPTLANMASHIHGWADATGGAGIPLTQVDAGFGYNNESFSGPYSITGTNLIAAGGGQPFNIMQPSAFWNVMIKL
jgi:hypothetical protein